MIGRMLSHPNIHVLLNADYREVITLIRFRRLIFTGPIDVFFDSAFGSLPYRSIEFRWETYDMPEYQHTSVVNYPGTEDFTRIVEYKYLNQQVHPRTTVSRDYPCWNNDEPYYPVPTAANRAMYRQYRDKASRLKTVFFCGRLGTYQYYNMDQCVAQALHLFEHLARFHPEQPCHYMARVERFIYHP